MSIVHTPSSNVEPRAPRLPMPIQFANGTRWERFLIRRMCGCTIGSDRLRGYVTRPTPHVAQIEGQAQCGCGREPLSFLVRVYDDERMLFYVKGTWIEVKAPSFVDKMLWSLKRAIKRAIGRP
ncbi:MAG: hypothetical protein KGL39_21510 [Patescibacteria group bacterium]|nr:hypothetical protein [Patescibacteria group bacterium]